MLQTTKRLGPDGDVALHHHLVAAVLPLESGPTPRSQ